jgi:hypothetical protein
MAGIRIPGKHKELLMRKYFDGVAINKRNEQTSERVAGKKALKWSFSYLSLCIYYYENLENEPMDLLSLFYFILFSFSFLKDKEWVSEFISRWMTTQHCSLGFFFSFEGFLYHTFVLLQIFRLMNSLLQQHTKKTL